MADEKDTTSKPKRKASAKQLAALAEGRRRAAEARKRRRIAAAQGVPSERLESLGFELDPLDPKSKTQDKSAPKPEAEMPSKPKSASNGGRPKKPPEPPPEEDEFEEVEEEEFEEVEEEEEDDFEDADDDDDDSDEYEYVEEEEEDDDDPPPVRRSQEDDDDDVVVEPGERMMEEQEVLQIGALDPESERLNTDLDTVLRQRAMGKKVPYGARGARLYNACMGLHLPKEGDRVKVYIEQTKPNTVHKDILPGTAIPDYSDLVKHIQTRHWRGDDAEYKWTVYSHGHRQRASDTIRFEADPITRQAWEARALGMQGIHVPGNPASMSAHAAINGNIQQPDQQRFQQPQFQQQQPPQQWQQQPPAPQPSAAPPPQQQPAQYGSNGQYQQPAPPPRMDQEPRRQEPPQPVSRRREEEYDYDDRPRRRDDDDRLPPPRRRAAPPPMQAAYRPPRVEQEEDEPPEEPPPDPYAQLMEFWGQNFTKMNERLEEIAKRAGPTPREPEPEDDPDEDDMGHHPYRRPMHGPPDDRWDPRYGYAPPMPQQMPDTRVLQEVSRDLALLQGQMAGFAQSMDQMKTTIAQQRRVDYERQREQERQRLEAERQEHERLQRRLAEDDSRQYGGHGYMGEPRYRQDEPYVPQAAQGYQQPAPQMPQQPQQYGQAVQPAPGAPPAAQEDLLQSHVDNIVRAIDVFGNAAAKLGFTKPTAQPQQPPPQQQPPAEAPRRTLADVPEVPPAVRAAAQMAAPAMAHAPSPPAQEEEDSPPIRLIETGAWRVATDKQNKPLDWMSQIMFNIDNLSGVLQQGAQKYQQMKQAGEDSQKLAVMERAMKAMAQTVADLRDRAQYVGNMPVSDGFVPSLPGMPSGGNVQGPPPNWNGGHGYGMPQQQQPPQPQYQGPPPNWNGGHGYGMPQQQRPPEPQYQPPPQQRQPYPAEPQGPPPGYVMSGEAPAQAQPRAPAPPPPPQAPRPKVVRPTVVTRPNERPKVGGLSG